MVLAMLLLGKNWTAFGGIIGWVLHNSIVKYLSKKYIPNHTDQK
jgi:hypothetical protein